MLRCDPVGVRRGRSTPLRQRLLLIIAVVPIIDACGIQASPSSIDAVTSTNRTVEADAADGNVHVDGGVEDAPSRGGRVIRPSASVVLADGCSWADLADSFSVHIQPHLSGCRSCHDSTAPPGLLKAPGPPWLVPGDGIATVKALLKLGAITVESPLQSKLLLMPLAQTDGGLPHPGGTRFGKSSSIYGDFVAFIERTSTCVTVP